MITFEFDPDDFAIWVDEHSESRGIGEAIYAELMGWA
jgi:hypothetical protein